jgi:uncharacterized protein YbcI
MPEIQSESGTVAADVSRGAVQLLRQYTGRGPTRARTLISKDTLAIVLGDTLTKGERTYVARGEGQHVLDTRRILQEVMREEFVRLVERFSGRKVAAFLSDDHINPDCAVEFFLLEPKPPAENKGSPGEKPTESAG